MMKLRNNKKSNMEGYNSKAAKNVNTVFKSINYYMHAI